VRNMTPLVVTAPIRFPPVVNVLGFVSKRVPGFGVPGVERQRAPRNPASCGVAALHHSHPQQVLRQSLMRFFAVSGWRKPMNRATTSLREWSGTGRSASKSRCKWVKLAVGCHWVPLGAMPTLVVVGMSLPRFSVQQHGHAGRGHGTRFRHPIVASYGDRGLVGLRLCLASPCPMASAAGPRSGSPGLPLSAGSSSRKTPTPAHR